MQIPTKRAAVVLRYTHHCLAPLSPGLAEESGLSPATFSAGALMHIIPPHPSRSKGLSIGVLVSLAYYSACLRGQCVSQVPEGGR